MGSGNGAVGGRRRTANWAMCLQSFLGLLLIFLLVVVPVTDARDITAEDGECESDLDCKKHELCTALKKCQCQRPWEPRCNPTTETTTINRENSRRSPQTDTDYSGVVKLALGAAIVMLAGVILALVWNLYREKRRLVRGPAHTGRRNRNGSLPYRRRTRTIPPQDLPPSYNDIFIISAAETARRHDKPPSYDEAMHDQQIPIVPGPAYINFAFTNDVGNSRTLRFPTVTATNVQSQEAGNAMCAVPPYSSSPPSGNNLASLNVASIISRLRSSLAEPTTRTSLDYSSMTSPCRRAVQGLSEPSVRKEMPEPIITVRRTMSGRAGDGSSSSYISDLHGADSLDGEEEVSASSSSPTCRNNATSITLESETGDGALSEMNANHQATFPEDNMRDDKNAITSISISVGEPRKNSTLLTCLRVSSTDTPYDASHQNDKAASESSVLGALTNDPANQSPTAKTEADQSASSNDFEKQTDLESIIITDDARAHESPLGVLRLTSAVSDC